MGNRSIEQKKMGTRARGSLLVGCCLFVLAVGLVGCGGGGGGGGGGTTSLNPVSPVAIDAALEANIVAAIEKVRVRKLNTRDNTPWVVLHAIIGFDTAVTVEVVETGQAMNGVDYLCTVASYDNHLIFRTQNGQPALPTRDLSYGMTDSFKVQDHVDQFLGYFADVGVPTTQKIIADDGSNYTVADMVTSSMRNFKPSQELGWTLVALPYYYGVDKPFINDAGETYTIADLMSVAALRDSKSEAEAGTHHLYAMAYALKKYQDAGGKLEGAWSSARSYLDQHIVLAKQCLQSDGTFSMNQFGGWNEADSPSLRVWGNGHMIEWLYLALSADQIKEEWVGRAVLKLAQDIQNYDLNSFSDGGMYHGTHGLALYRKAVFGATK